MTPPVSETHRTDTEIVLTRTVRAPRARVWEAWTQPAHLDRWYGPAGFVTTTHRHALAVGGEWHFTMAHPEYGSFYNRARFTAVQAPERLCWDYDDGRDEDPDRLQVEVRFEDLGEQTRVVLRSIFTTPEAAARAGQGYAVEAGHQTLGKLAALVEAPA